jgi:hypothetical protein
MIHSQPAQWLSTLATMPQSSDWEQSSGLILQGLCESIRWDYGEIWRVQEDPNLLCLSPTWHLSPSVISGSNRQSWQQFRACSLEFTLHLGEGLPGRVYESRQPEWVVDVSIQSEGYFLRHHIAKAFSVRAGLGLPLLVGSQVRAVLVFFKSKSCPEDREMITGLQAMLEQIEPLFQPTEN